MINKKLITAAAGSGKTTFLIQEAIKITDRNVLITTFTEANEQEIKKKFIEQNKFIPNNVTISTWFSFLLQHGVKPYQGCLTECNIKGMILYNGQSSKYIAQNNIEKYYFDPHSRIYSDKISKFAIECNKKSKGLVLKRLSIIYSAIFIDELQDLSGYDLEFVKLILNSNYFHILLVGDPRQAVYSTNYSIKNSKYRKSKVINFFDDHSIEIEKDSSSLSRNYRSIQAICNFSDKLFPSYQKTTSGNHKERGHDGIFLVRQTDVDQYLNEYQPYQLRDSSRKTITNNYPVMNFGLSKGLTFDRVLIYPTTPIIKWIKNNIDLKPVSKSKLYVAITRARYSVAFVYNYNDDEIVLDLKKYKVIENDEK